MTQIGTRNDTNSAPPNAAVGPPRHAIFAKEPKAYERLFFLCKRLTFRRNTHLSHPVRSVVALILTGWIPPSADMNDMIGFRVVALVFTARALTGGRSRQRCFGPRAFGAKVESSQCQIPTPSTPVPKSSVEHNGTRGMIVVVWSETGRRP